MLYIAHRINTIEALKTVPSHYGIEVDIRDGKDGKLILQHDPFKDGEDLDEFLGHYTHKLIILNIKSERIEIPILELLKKHGITSYFFLDSSFPMIIHLLTHFQESNTAIRFSEYEGLDTILALKGKVKWVWVDCFTKLPLTPDTFSRLKEAGFQLCLVSPELQGRPNDIVVYRDYLNQNRLQIDAICTKMHNIPIWKP